jgi:hypothetical protein
MQPESTKALEQKEGKETKKVHESRLDTKTEI